MRDGGLLRAVVRAIRRLLCAMASAGRRECRSQALLSSQPKINVMQPHEQKEGGYHERNGPRSIEGYGYRCIKEPEP